MFHTAVCRLAVGLGLLLCVTSVAGRTAEEWKSRLIYHILTDRFARGDDNTLPQCESLREYCGGTYRGVINKLDYIQGLGANAIYISPHVENTPGGYHGYWAKNFFELNPEFGPSSDLFELIAECHRRDIWVMMDVVPNHMGYPDDCSWDVCNNPIDFDEFVPFNLEEHYHEYCNIRDFTNQTEVELCRLADLPDLNQTVPFVRTILYNWIEQQGQVFEFDGYRIDTVRHIEKGFWPEYQERAGRFCVGEVSGDNTTDIGDYQNYMDSLLNFPLYWTARRVYTEGLPMTALVENLQLQRQEFRDTSVLGNFIDNHDFFRFLFIDPDVVKLQNNLVYILFAEGIPLIYYGTEQGFNGGGDPENRESLWPYHDTESFLYQYIRQLSTLRSEILSLIVNTPQEELYADDNVLVFTRSTRRVVVVNSKLGTGGEADVTVPGFGLFSDGTVFRNGLDTTDTVSVEGGVLNISITNGEPKVYLMESLL